MAQPSLSATLTAVSAAYSTRAPLGDGDVPIGALGAREEGTLFHMVDKLVDVAASHKVKGKARSASSLLTRAHKLANDWAAAGSLAGRVARAYVAVQHCALLSHLGQHTASLKDALAAAKEAEEIWNQLLSAAGAKDETIRLGEMLKPGSTYAALLQDPPPWIDRAITVLIQAKHCVAVELEFSVVEAPGDRSDVAMDDPSISACWELIPALHREAVSIATQLLPTGDPLLELSAKTEAQATARRSRLGRWLGQPVLEEPDWWNPEERAQATSAPRQMPRPSSAPVLQGEPWGERDSFSRSDGLVRSWNPWEPRECRVGPGDLLDLCLQPEKAASQSRGRGQGVSKSPTALRRMVAAASGKDAFEDWLKPEDRKPSHQHLSDHNLTGQRLELRKESANLRHSVAQRDPASLYETRMRFSPAGLAVQREAGRRRGTSPKSMPRITPAKGRCSEHVKTLRNLSSMLTGAHEKPQNEVVEAPAIDHGIAAMLRMSLR